MGRLFQSFQQADTSSHAQVRRHRAGTGHQQKPVGADGRCCGRGQCGRTGVHLLVHRTPGTGEAKAQLHIPRTDFQTRRVLVVDDNAHAALVLADLLGAIGFGVESVSSGAEAIAAVQAASAAGKAFDFVMLDWQMPEMDGITAAAQIRQLGLQPQPRMVMVTAYGREEVIKGAQDAGIDEILIKPVNASLLFDTVMRLLGHDHPDAQNTHIGQRTAGLHALAPLRGARILVVEDNELNQQIAMELLSDAGFQVDLASNGQVALDRITAASDAGSSYDLVFMDMQMPVMDGVTASETIRRQPRYDTLPVVAMTANAMQADRDRCTAAGMNDFLTKPIEPEELWAALARWIRPRDGLGQAPATPAHPASTSWTAPAATAASHGVEDTLPTDIEGLDTQLGLRRVLGKHSLYLSMLRKFVAGNSTLLEPIEHALQAGEREVAERHAHTLKGLAGNIGASTLQQEMARLEMALHEQRGPEEIRSLMAAPAASLSRLLAQLNAKLPPDAQAQAAAAVDPEQLQAVCRELQGLLADDDAQAADVLSTHAALLRTALGPNFRAIEAAVEGFDFEAALQALHNAASHAEIAL